jgi:predicted phosphate transport protein (TIGR00153 family)
MVRFIPREEKFFDFLRDAAGNILRAAEILKQMMDSYQDPASSARDLKELEHEGDKITHDIIRMLNRTFITPIDREDIYSLTSALDDILDLIEAAADRMVLYQIQAPTPEAKDLSAIIYDSAKEISCAIGRLSGLDHVYEHCVEINRLENAADRITRDAIARLFQGGYDPFQVIKWKEIYETLEAATDKCEDAANVIEAVVLKQG